MRSGGVTLAGFWRSAEAQPQRVAARSKRACCSAAAPQIGVQLTPIDTNARRPRSPTC